MQKKTIVSHLCGTKSCAARTPFQGVQRFICRLTVGCQNGSKSLQMHECGQDIWCCLKTGIPQNHDFHWFDNGTTWYHSSVLP